MFAFFRRKKQAHKTRQGSISFRPCLEVLEERMVLNGSFSDGFESPGLDAFWNRSATISGSIERSSAQAHSGSFSLAFNTVNTGSNKDVELKHDFAIPSFGRVSVWVLDTGADQASSNYIALDVSTTAAGNGWSIGTFDYDLGSHNGGSYYAGDYDATVNTGVDRTNSWHNWVVDSRPNTISFEVDGRTVASYATANPIDEITMRMNGPWWRPAWTAYFDDFEFVPFGQADIDMQSAELVSGNTVQFNYETTGDPGPFDVGFYQSADATFDASDSLIATQPVTPSPTNQQTPGTFTLPATLPVSDGTKPFIVVVADPANAITESKDDNNVQSLRLPDIAATSLTFDTAQGGVNFQYTVTGAPLPQDAAAFLYWASGPSENDILDLATANPITIPKGVAQDTVHIPSSDLLTPVPAGATHLVVVADPSNAIAESDEGNNMAFIPIRDLTPISVAWNPGAGGFDFTYTAQGDFKEATTAKVYWASGTAYADRLSDTPVFTHTIDAGDRGSEAKSYTVNVPKDSFLKIAPEGTIYLIVVIDHDDLIGELKEDNNVLALADVTVSYDNVNSVYPSQVLPSTIEVIKAAGRYAGQQNTIITSTNRTPEDQARIMLNDARTDIKYAYGLYNKYGDQVIREYEKAAKEYNQELKKYATDFKNWQKAVAKNPKLEPPTQPVEPNYYQLMLDKIYELGPTNVSKHLENYLLYQVVDMSFTRSSNPLLFHEALTKLEEQGYIDRLLDPYTPVTDKAFHIEIAQ